MHYGGANQAVRIRRLITGIRQRGLFVAVAPYKGRGTSGTLYPSLTHGVKPCLERLSERTELNGKR